MGKRGMKLWIGLGLAALLCAAWTGDTWGARGGGGGGGRGGGGGAGGGAGRGAGRGTGGDTGGGAGQPGTPEQGQTITPDWAVVTPNTVYTKENPPATPALESLPLKASVTQYGITWTFAEPARVGRFVNGDYYVVGGTVVTGLDPKPLYGKDIPATELDSQDKSRSESQRVRNGFMLNPPAADKVAYDSGVRNYFAPGLIQKLPVKMRPGDSLVSTISMPMGLKINAPLRNAYARGDEDASPTRVAAVLTCVGEPLPPDAFRPAFCDRQGKIYLARNLKRTALPTLAVSSLPTVAHYAGFTQKPWVGTCLFTFAQPLENMPAYGTEYGRVVGIAALILCTDLKPEEKEPLLVNFVQVGLDLGGMIRAGHPGWEAFGGFGSGRKLPIVFAGLLLGDMQLANINKSYPRASFGEDEMTAYGDCWTGAKVVFTGHRGIDEKTGIARSGTGPYEHKQPKDWSGIATGPDRTGDKCSESYRRCCTSICWIGQALALRLIKAEKVWNHDAFFDYCDRWMFEDEGPLLSAAGLKEDSSAREGQCWDHFVEQMWARYRAGPDMPPTDGWKKPHDDSYLRNAIGQGRK